jgi:hypothetical protein
MKKPRGIVAGVGAKDFSPPTEYVADFRDRQIQKELRNERRVVIPLFKVSFDSIKNFFRRK